MAEKRRLGRGLGALIPDMAGNDPDLREIPVGKVQPNPYQPRVSFNEEKLRELADSIREHGVIQPVIVTPRGGDYLLVAGERRLRAAIMAGLETVPALTREFNPDTMLQIALIENLQREDLNPIEEATAYRQLIEQFNYTQEELSTRLGRSRPAIANTIRLLALGEKAKQMLAGGELSAGQARPLLAITDESIQGEIANKIIREGLSARKVEKYVCQFLKGAATSPEKAAWQDQEDPAWKELQDKFEQHLGTRVRITAQQKGGVIQIDFFGEEDLDRIIALLLPEWMDNSCFT